MAMSFVTVKAHYDGEKVCLDETVDLAPNTEVLVVIPQGDGLDQFRKEWFAHAQAAFARAYGEDEPDYADAVILEPPPRE